MGEYRNKDHKIKLTATPNEVCPVCGMGFHLKPSAIAKNKTHCCSRKCAYIFRKTQYAGSGNPQYGLKGNLNASWKSDYRETRFGYMRVRVLDHPFRDQDDFVLEHRLVAERYLLTDENSVCVDGKRYLKPEYVVHHKDFDRLNNRPENLVVMTGAEHRSLHNRLSKRTRDERRKFVEDQKKVKFKFVTETATMPRIASKYAAGWDLYADTDTETRIAPGETVVFGSGVAVQMPAQFYGEVFSRSGLSTRKGLCVATGTSVIDNDYRGEIKIPLRNFSDETQVIAPHERIAQLVFVKGVQVELVKVERLDDTERGTSGFGSTGR